MGIQIKQDYIHADMQLVHLYRITEIDMNIRWVQSGPISIQRIGRKNCVLEFIRQGRIYNGFKHVN